MIRILVTGANGQLGKSFQKISGTYTKMLLTFKTSKDLDITNAAKVNALFSDENFDYCVNCAAYTNVELAENDIERAYLINADGVRNLALACAETGVVLAHISTDYVFDGEKKGPYTTKDIANPINVYGNSKLAGEKYIQKILKNYFIVRTSWLYSDYGKNFYKTILAKASIGEDLKITDEQMGCPTSATNLAHFILNLISTKSTTYGIHHFTDGQAMTWYGFARKILDDHGLLGMVNLEKAKNYRTFARRPKNSVLI